MQQPLKSLDIKHQLIINTKKVAGQKTGLTQQKTPNQINNPEQKRRFLAVEPKKDFIFTTQSQFYLTNKKAEKQEKLVIL